MENSIKSIKRTIQILNLFTLDCGHLGVSEIAQKLNMNKSTVSRVMTTLESGNIVKKSLGSRTYCLDRKVAELARVFLSNIDLKTVASPYLKALHEKTGEVISIYIIEGDQRRCIDWIETSNRVRYVMNDSYVYGPLHASAPGKLLLACLPDEEIEQLIERTGLPRYTEFTFTNKKELRKEIKKIRKNGLAISKGEHIRLACGIAAPVRNYLSKVIAALTITWIMGSTDSKLEEK